MPISPSLYEEGTVTLENGNATVLGDGTAWIVNGVAGGIFARADIAVPIRGVEADGELTLAYGWPGPDESDVPYCIARESALAADATFVHNSLVKVIRDLSLSALMPDGSGTLAERNALSPVPSAGYIWLRVEVGYPLELYRKETSGWSGPYDLSGPEGPRGEAATVAVNSTTTIEPGEDADVTNSGTAGEALLNFFIPKGEKGDQGDIGPQGAPGLGSGGYGLPVGGSDGQVLLKDGASDGAAVWADLIIPTSNFVWLDDYIESEGPTDDMAAALGRAFDELPNGGRVLLTPGKDYYVLTNVTIPPLCLIDGGMGPLDMFVDAMYAGHGTLRFSRGLVVASTATINTLGSAGLTNVFCRRQGWAHTDLLPTAYAGTLMTSLAYAPVIENVMAVGFNKLLDTGDDSRVWINRLYGDPVNGLDMERSADVTRIRDIHLWPFGTIEAYVADGATNVNALLRAGTALKWIEGSAGALLDGFFSLGYTNGVELSTLSTLNAGRVRCELPPEANAGSVGLKVSSAVDAIYLASLTLSGYEKMIQVNTTVNNQVNIGHFEGHLGDGTCLEVIGGDITIGTWLTWGRDGILIDVQNTLSNVNILKAYHRLSGWVMTDYIKVVANCRADRIRVDLRHNDPAWTGVSLFSGGAFVLPAAGDAGGVFSAPPQHDKYASTSSADLLTINGGWAGRELSIRFVAARDIKPGGNINIPCAFHVTAGQMVTFVYSGENWTPLTPPSGLYRTVLSIANGAVATITPSNATGFIRAFAAGTSANWFHGYFRTGASPVMTQIAAGTYGAGANTDLTVTPGADTFLTVGSNASGTIQIQNRTGATRNVVVIMETAG